MNATASFPSTAAPRPVREELASAIKRMQRQEARAQERYQHLLAEGTTAQVATSGAIWDLVELEHALVVMRKAAEVADGLVADWTLPKFYDQAVSQLVNLATGGVHGSTFAPSNVEHAAKTRGQARAVDAIRDAMTYADILIVDMSS